MAKYRTKYQSRTREKLAAETLKLCDKNLLDKTYCEQFKKKLARQPGTEKDSAKTDAAKDGSSAQK